MITKQKQTLARRSTPNPYLFLFASQRWGPIKWLWMECMLSTVRSAEGGEGDMTLSKRNETHLVSPRVFWAAKRLHLISLVMICQDALSVSGSCSFKIADLRNLPNMWFCMLVANCCWRICLIFLKISILVLTDTVRSKFPPPHMSTCDLSAKPWMVTLVIITHEPTNQNQKKMLPTFPNLLNWSINSIKPHLSYPT